MKSFERSLESFRPDMLVVTGFHMLGSQDSSFRMKQGDMIVDLYSRLSAERSIPIHAEVSLLGTIFSVLFSFFLFSSLLNPVHSWRLWDLPSTGNSSYAMHSPKFIRLDSTNKSSSLLIKVGSNFVRWVFVFCLKFF